AGVVVDNCTLDEHTVDLLSRPGVRLAKIDRQLTLDLATSKSARMRIAAIAQIARVGGVHTVAKQVERAEEQELPPALGGDFLQGQAVAAPAPIDNVDRWREQRLIVDVEASNAMANVGETAPVATAPST